MASEALRIAMVGSGRSTHAISRAAAVASRGHAVRLVTLGEVLPGAPIEVCSRPLPRGPIEAARAARSFWRDVRNFEPDLLHVHYAGGRLGTLATLAGDWPLAVTVMGGDVLAEQHFGGQRRIERRATQRILQRADVIFAKSDALRPAIIALGGEEARIETVRWGIDPECFRPEPEAAAALRSRLGLEPGRPIVLSSRILRPLYEVHRIVEAMPAILERLPRAVLLVTDYNAEATYRDQVERRARDLGLDESVRLIGRVDQPDMPALYSLADVVVSVPLSDGLPQTLFEAMGCETPCVLARLPAYEEVVRDGETAVLTDRAPSAIASAVLSVLGDGERRTRIGKAARQQAVEIASLPRELERVESRYRAALADPRPRHLAPVAKLVDLLGLLLR